MTDTYNDTTGSRKKFLIPLVVLLLCAVSLTGAGYAYNATVTSQDNTAPIDEVFTIDLYDNDTNHNIVTGPITVANVNGLVFNTDKILSTDNEGHPVVALSGEFNLEDVDPVVLQAANNVKYTGLFAITADNLYRGDANHDGSTTTTKANLTIAQVDNNTPYVAFKDGATYSVADNASIEAVFHIYTDAACEHQIADNEIATYEFTVNDAQAANPVYYYYQIEIVSVSNATVANANDNQTGALAFANAVVTDIELEFNFKFTVDAIEE